jgi:hypothetical protein
VIPGNGNSKSWKERLSLKERLSVRRAEGIAEGGKVGEAKARSLSESESSLKLCRRPSTLLPEREALFEIGRREAEAVDEVRRMGANLSVFSSH